MRHIIRTISFLTFVFIVSCKSNDNNNVTANQDNTLQNFQSSFCSGITGPKGAYWDFGHGKTLPLTQIPVIKNPGSQFIHSQLPYLSLTLPVGFSAIEVNDPSTQAIGVNVVRNDGLVAWRYVPSMTILGNVNATDVMAQEINSIFANFNFNGNYTVLCSSSDSTTENGFFIQAEARLVQFGDMTTQVGIRVMKSAAAGASFITIYTVFAPTSEYDTQVMETFLPFTYQLFVNPDNTLSDRDNDGVPDVYDSAPDDPTRQ